MKIRILTVGTRMPQWVEDGCRTYQQRLQGVQVVEWVEIPLAKRGKNTEPTKAMALEADAIEKAIRPNEHIVVLDVEGKALSTPALAKKLSGWQMARQNVTILIGGPDVLDASFRGGRYERLSLSTLTMPHPLVRLVLIEQIYRGLMINANHPYHRE